MSAEAGAAPGRLIAFRNDRLGARLLTLVNAMRLSADHGIGWACHWPLATDVSAVFNDPTELFDADWVGRHFIDRTEWRALRKGTIKIGDALRRDGAWLRAAAARGRSIAVDQAFGVNALADEDAAEMRARFVATLRAVPFAAPLRPVLEVLDRALDGATAYHIRRGDLTEGLSAKNKPWPHKMVPHEFYELHIERELGAHRAILFSDDAATLAHYRALFPALRTIGDIADLGGLTEAQRDLAELYAMSRAAKIIAPERSAFSSTAEHMGAAVKRTVTDDMTPAMRETAYERLIARLRDRPESFVSDGEIGQSLAHVGPYLAARGRSAEAAGLYAARLEDGLNIAFVYADAMRHQHRAGDVAGVLRTGALAHARPVFNLRYFADAEFQHGYGHIRAGDVPRGLRHIANGFWHGPLSGEARMLVPALVALDLLRADNFLPVAALHRTLLNRKAPLRQLARDYPGILRLAGSGAPGALGGVEAAVWDWAALMRANPVGAAVRDGETGRMRKRLAAAAPETDADRAERASLLAVLDAYEGRADDAAGALAALAAGAPDCAMTWQRLAHALLIGRHVDEAADAAEQAAARAPDWPALHAWAGVVLLRARRTGPALARLAAADAAEIGIASIPAFHAQALAEDGRPAEALAAIGRAVALAPMEADFAMRHADILETLGRPDDAIGVLAAMVDRHRAPCKMFRRLVDLMRAAGDGAGAAEMIRTCAERYPDHPTTREMQRERAA